MLLPLLSVMSGNVIIIRMSCPLRACGAPEEVARVLAGIISLTPWPSLLEKQEVRRGQLEGLGGEGLALSGLAGARGRHLRRGGRPESWLEISEPRSACSPNILFTADGSHDSFSLQFRLHFPSLCSPSC